MVVKGATTHAFSNLSNETKRCVLLDDVDAVTTCAFRLEAVLQLYWEQHDYVSANRDQAQYLLEDCAEDIINASRLLAELVKEYVASYDKDPAPHPEQKERPSL